MFWADKIASELKNKGPQHIEDMKTPSGRVHVGALRGVIIHDLVYKALINAGIKAKYTYVFDDNDPMDSLPVYLSSKKYRKYMGFPLNKIPSPGPGAKNFAEFYALEFERIFNQLGAKPEIIWASRLYKSGKLDGGIAKCLDNADKIRKIYKRVAGANLAKDWFPFNVICENCGKIGTTRVYGWDGEKVSYKCHPHVVAWAEGCNYKGKISPFGGTGKLPWKVYWAVKWQVLRVTIEGAGKDHMSKGGSHDIASAIAEEILGYPTPYAVSYEFFLFGGKKMSSSKGLGSLAAEVAAILPPELLRFLMVRTNFRQAINFDPGGMTIPNFFDEYDRCAQEWFVHKRKSDLGRIFELSQIGKIPKKEINYPRFRDVATFVQMPGVDLKKQFPGVGQKILGERIKYAKIWLESYASEEMAYRISKKVPEAVKTLSLDQKKYLEKVLQLIKSKTWQPKDLEFELYEEAKKQKISSQKAFESIYVAFIGKTYGPKAAWFLLTQDKNFIIRRLEEVLKK